MCAKWCTCIWTPSLYDNIFAWHFSMLKTISHFRLRAPSDVEKSPLNENTFSFSPTSSECFVSFHFIASNRLPLVCYLIHVYSRSCFVYRFHKLPYRLKLSRWLSAIWSITNFLFRFRKNKIKWSHYHFMFVRPIKFTVNCNEATSSSTLQMKCSMEWLTHISFTNPSTKVLIQYVSELSTR